MGDNVVQETAALAAAIAAANRPPACLNAGLSTQNTTIIGYQNLTVIGLELSLFYNVLFSIHLNNDTIKELIQHGLISLKELTLFSKKDLEKFSKSVLCNKSPNATNNNWFPVKAQLNLQYLHLWGILCKMCGVPLDCNNWDMAVEMPKLVNRKRELDACNKNKSEINDPAKLKSMKEWDRFHEALISYLRTRRGANSIPLAYIVRPQATSTLADYQTDYDNKDERYIWCTVLSGPLYKADNKVVWELLKCLLLNGDAWTFISKWDVKKDGLRVKGKENGREAYLVLIQQSVQVNCDEN